MDAPLVHYGVVSSPMSIGTACGEVGIVTTWRENVTCPACEEKIAHADD